MYTNISCYIISYYVILYYRRPGPDHGQPRRGRAEPAHDEQQGYMCIYIYIYIHTYIHINLYYIL